MAATRAREAVAAAHLLITLATADVEVDTRLNKNGFWAMVTCPSEGQGMWLTLAPAEQEGELTFEARPLSQARPAPALHASRSCNSKQPRHAPRATQRSAGRCRSLCQCGSQ